MLVHQYVILTWKRCIRNVVKIKLWRNEKNCSVFVKIELICYQIPQYYHFWGGWFHIQLKRPILFWSVECSNCKGTVFYLMKMNFLFKYCMQWLQEYCFLHIGTFSDEFCIARILFCFESHFELCFTGRVGSNLAVVWHWLIVTVQGLCYYLWSVYLLAIAQMNYEPYCLYCFFECFEPCHCAKSWHPSTWSRYSLANSSPISPVTRGLTT